MLACVRGFLSFGLRALTSIGQRFCAIGELQHQLLVFTLLLNRDYTFPKLYQVWWNKTDQLVEELAAVTAGKSIFFACRKLKIESLAFLSQSNIFLGETIDPP